MKKVLDITPKEVSYITKFINESFFSNSFSHLYAASLVFFNHLTKKNNNMEGYSENVQ